MPKAEQLQIRLTARQKATIRRAARRAGMDMSSWILSRVLPDPQRVWDELIEQLRQNIDQPSYALAAINDWLTSVSGEEFRLALQIDKSEQEHVTACGLGKYLDNYLAAMIEVAAHQKGIAPPAWTSRIMPLARPVFGSEMLSLRVWLLTHAPVPFRRRNIFIDSSIGQRV